MNTEALQIFPALTWSRGAVKRGMQWWLQECWGEQWKWWVFSVKGRPTPPSIRRKCEDSPHVAEAAALLIVGSQNLIPVHTYLTIPFGLIKRITFWFICLWKSGINNNLYSLGRKKKKCKFCQLVCNKRVLYMAYFHSCLISFLKWIRVEQTVQECHEKRIRSFAVVHDNDALLG